MIEEYGVIQQGEFDFGNPAEPPAGVTHKELRVCEQCGSDFYYFEFPNTEQNRAHPSWINYCCRKCFVKGIYQKWANTSQLMSIMMIEKITPEELVEAETAIKNHASKLRRFSI